jgi:hypothetical protein
MAEEELFVSLYLDADVERVIAKALRQRGYTCHAADEVGMKRSPMKPNWSMQPEWDMLSSPTTSSILHLFTFDTYRRGGSTLALC